VKPIDPLPHDHLGFEGISRGGIRHWRLLLLGAFGLLLVAWMAWKRIPRLEDPLIEPPLVFVTMTYPGASPEDVESQLVKPVEEELFGMEGVEYVESVALPNYAHITMKFEDGTSMENAVETVRGKVFGKRKDLPAEVGDPQVSRAKSATFSAQMVVMVVGNRADGVLTDAAKHVKDAITAIPGVGSVTLRGARTRAVRIRLDPARLAEHHMSVAQVVERIKLANVRVPGGEIKVGTQVALLSVNHELKDADAVARISVGASGDGAGGTRTVSLGDVADVRDDFRVATERMIHDGIPAVGLEIRFRAGENAVQVGQEVRARLDAERLALPQGTEIKVAHDQPEWVRRSLSSFIESLVEGVLLVMLIITLGMGWRSAVVVAMVLPLAIAGAVFGLFTLGFALEQVSIAGLIVALGLLVDDAVVVTESIQLMRDRGLSGLRAAVLGTARVFWANNGTTAVACASFLPLFFMGGDIGSFIKGLPTAVVLALVTSLFVAQLLTPWIATFFLKAPSSVTPIADTAVFDRSKDSAGSSHEERNIVLRGVKAAYAWSIPWVIDNPIKVVAVAVLMLIGSGMLLPKVGFQFFPKADKPVLFVSVELPRGTDDSVTGAKVTQILAELRKDPAVRATSAVVGAAYPTIVLGRAIHPASKDYADVLVQLTGPSTDAIARRLRTSLASIPGVKISVEELYHGPPVPHPIMIRVQGDEYAKLRHYADEIKTRLRQVPGTVNVSDTLTDSIPLANVQIDADRAFRFGITPGQIGQTLRFVYGEDKISSFRQGLDTVEIVVERAESTDNPLEQVAQTPVPSLTFPSAKGGGVPVLAVGDVSITRGFAELRRRNTRRIVNISADVDGATLPSVVLQEMKPALEKMTWDRGYGFAFGGEQAEQEKSFRNLGLAATGTLLLIFVLLVLMFGSLTRAAIVLAAVPFALIGAVSGLYLTNNPFGFMAFLGLVALIGVYVNHKIYFVDRMHELTVRGLDWRTAIFQAGIDRLRPVVLTALTAILGLLPLTLGGGAFWAAFGWVNIFGLATSIPLSLVLLPALLALTYRFRKPEARAAAEAARATDAADVMPESTLTF
jgi:multidrug efflux pump subunit AcrB